MSCLIGLVVVGRFFSGAFGIAGIPQNPPLNVEGLFGLAVTILMAWRVSPDTPAKPNGASSHLILALCGVALVSVLSHARVIGLQFLSDDFVLLRQANQWTWQNLIPNFTNGGGDGAFRPLGLLSLALNAKWAGEDPMLWHAFVIILHTLNAVLAAWLAARLGLSAFAAFLTGVLFAIHSVHLEVSAWVAGHFDLVATLFTLSGLLFFTLDRLWARLAGLACCLGGVLSKEAAFVFPLLLIALLRFQRRSLRLALPTVALTGLIFAYRWTVMGGIGGYTSATGQPTVLSLGLPSKAKTILVSLWTRLYFPINWSVEPAWVIAVLALAMIAAALWMTVRSTPGRVIWFALVAVLISILPPLHLLSATRDLAGGRLLYLSSVWFCLMMAGVVEGVPAKRARWACAAAIILFQSTALQHNLDFWVATSERVQEMCKGASEGVFPSELPGSIEGVPAFNNGFDDCVSIARRNAARRTR